MANKFIQMTQRNAANTGWDDVYPNTTPQGVTGSYATATGTNTLTLTLTPAATKLVVGAVYRFKNTTANTGNVTLNINGLGAKAVLRNGGTQIPSGGLKANFYYAVLWDGSNFILQSEGGSDLKEEIARYINPMIVDCTIGVRSFPRNGFKLNSNTFGWSNGLSNGSYASGVDYFDDNFVTNTIMVWSETYYPIIRRMRHVLEYIPNVTNGKVAQLIEVDAMMLTDYTYTVANSGGSYTTTQNGAYYINYTGLSMDTTELGLSGFIYKFDDIVWLYTGKLNSLNLVKYNWKTKTLLSVYTIATKPLFLTSTHMVHKTNPDSYTTRFTITQLSNMTVVKTVDIKADSDYISTIAMYEDAISPNKRLGDLRAVSNVVAHPNGKYIVLTGGHASEGTVPTKHYGVSKISAQEVVNRWLNM